jgi:hypothetical protein
MSLVLDSSATLAWVYTEESTPAIQAIFRRVVESGAWVPGLWKLEVANILETGARRGRHTKAFRDATLRDLSRSIRKPTATLGIQPCGSPNVTASPHTTLPTWSSLYAAASRWPLWIRTWSPPPGPNHFSSSASSLLRDAQPPHRLVLSLNPHGPIIYAGPTGKFLTRSQELIEGLDEVAQDRNLRTHGYLTFRFPKDFPRAPIGRYDPQNPERRTGEKRLHKPARK